jgi:hypothetical protein
VDRTLLELPKARWVHLATHGWFADLDSPLINPFALGLRRKDSAGFSDSELRSAGRAPRERMDAFRRNPQICSCIVLAGANQPPRFGADGTPQDDGGLLTAESIGGLQLQDVEIVVLSACETGLAEIAEGEGLLGLQRAFHTGGAAQVASSLWRVDDRSTAALMRVFDHKLWRESRPAIEAMREAQLALYHDPKKIESLAQTRGPDFGREVTLLASVEPNATLNAGRAPTKQWAAFTISAPPFERAMRSREAPAQAARGENPSQAIDADAHVRLGIAFHQEAKLGAAVREYGEAIRQKPELAEAHDDLGLV